MAAPKGKRAGRAASTQQADYGLEHLKRYSVSQFLKEVDSQEIQVLESNTAGKYFFVDDAGNVLGAVSTRLMEDQENGEEVPPVVSLVQPLDGDEEDQFFLLHKKGEGKESLMTLTA